MQKKQFDDAIENGATFDEAVEAIKDARIRQRVVSYGNFGQCKTKDGTVLDIRGCAASFYPPEIEALVCGQRQDRYELLPRLDAVNATSLLIRIIDNFRVSIRALTDRSHNRPDLRIESEYDVQDVLFACVRASFNDARREEWAPQHAGSAKRIDIAIPSAGALVEVKFVRTAQHAKTIADELKIDIESYHTHPTCGTLLVLVYDPRTYIADPEAIEQDLSGRRTKKTSSFDVQVMVRR